MENFISTMAAAVVGALIATGGTVLVTYLVFKKERERDREAAQEQRELMLEVVARDAAAEMLDALGAMSVNLGSIGESEWNIVRHERWARTERRTDLSAGVVALYEVRRQHSSRAQLLPAELGGRWYEMVILLDEYRGVLVAKSNRDKAWTTEKRKRAYEDVVNYMAYVRDSLAEFIRSGTVIPKLEPPKLRREDLGPWAYETEEGC